MDLAAAPTDTAPRDAAVARRPSQRPSELVVAAGGALTMFAFGAALASGPNSARIGGTNEHAQLVLWLLLLVAGIVTAVAGALGLRSYRGLRAELAAGIVVIAAGVIAMAIASPNASDARTGVTFAIAWTVLVALAQIALAVAARLHAQAHHPA